MLPQSFKDNLTNWQALVENLKPHLTDMPNLTTDHDALTAVVTQAHTLETQQDLHKANLRDVNQQRKTLATQGKALRSRLATGLKLALGADNERLLEFRVNPRQRGIRQNRPSPAERAQKAAAQSARATAKAEAAAALAAAKQQAAKAAVS